MKKAVLLTIVIVSLILLSSRFSEPLQTNGQTSTPTPTTTASQDIGKWIQKVPMPTARYSLGVASVNGKIYAIGGIGAQGTSISANEEYDPTTNTWTTKASVPTARSEFAIAVYENKIYCIGGYVGYTTSGYTKTGTNEIYDTTTNTWTTKTSIPTPEAKFGANIVNGKIYCISGNLTYVYDPPTDTWSKKTSPPHYAIGYVSAIIDDKLYIMGQDFDPANSNNINQVYDTQTDTWSLGAPIPQTYPNIPSTGGAAATTGIFAPKEIVVIGGSYTTAITPMMSIDTTEIYYPENNSWAFGQKMPTARELLGVAVVNDIFYAIGGNTINASGIIPLASNEQFIPPGYGISDPTYQPTSPSPTLSPIITQLPTASPTPSPTASTQLPPTLIQQQTPQISITPTIINPNVWIEDGYWVVIAVVAVLVILAGSVALFRIKRKRT